MAQIKPVREPIINGVGYSWASLEIEVFCESTGQRWAAPQAFSSLNFNGGERERGFGYGPHPDPLFKTRGQNKYEASIKWYLHPLRYLKETILGGGGYRDRSFTLTIKYLEGGLDPVTVEIRGCTLDSSKTDNAKGTDATEVECVLNPLKIIWNGVDDVDNPLVRAA